MTIRTILACASGGTASDGAIEMGCRLAHRFEAHVEGFHVRPDPRELSVYAGDGFGVLLSGDWIDQWSTEIATKATRTNEAFIAAAARYGLATAAVPPKAGASVGWREETGYAPLLVSRRARFFDLVVLGRSDRVKEEPHTDTVEDTLIRSGRPVLLAPTRAPETLGDIIAVGWDGSPASVRALVAALPLLASARGVVVITIGDKHRQSVAAAMEYLAWHGVAARQCQMEPVSGVAVGERLLATARDEAADLLVMGGYGHMPWREMLFGGATRQIVGTSLLPILLSH